MKRFTIISMLLSLTFSMGAQTDSLITQMLNAAVISDGNMTYKIDRTTHFFTKEQMAQAREARDLVSGIPGLFIDQQSNSIKTVGAKNVLVLINGVKASDFPPLPVDYGYRDSKNFWFHRKTWMRAELLPIRKQSLESVRYAADRADDKVKFTDDALETILNVPRVFLPLVLKGCVEWARENNCELITAAEMKIINDKRAKEKNKK